MNDAERLRYIAGNIAQDQREHSALKLLDIAERLDEDESAADGWRRLALQFDGHRMQALGLLKLVQKHPGSCAEDVARFLAAPPLSGEEVLAERLAALDAARQK